MMDAADAYIERLIHEKRAAQDAAMAWSVIAACMQKLADGTGDGFGLMPLTPDLPMPVLQQIARQLGARLTPPHGEHTNGQRVPVGSSVGQTDATPDA